MYLCDRQFRREPAAQSSVRQLSEPHTFTLGVFPVVGSTGSCNGDDKRHVTVLYARSIASWHAFALMAGVFGVGRNGVTRDDTGGSTDGGGDRRPIKRFVFSSYAEKPDCATAVSLRRALTTFSSSRTSWSSDSVIAAALRALVAASVSNASSASRSAPIAQIRLSTASCHSFCF